MRINYNVLTTIPHVYPPTKYAVRKYFISACFEVATIAHTTSPTPKNS
jgi:hypothetical protein